MGTVTFKPRTDTVICTPIKPPTQINGIEIPQDATFVVENGKRFAKIVAVGPEAEISGLNVGDEVIITHAMAFVPDFERPDILYIATAAKHCVCVIERSAIVIPSSSLHLAGDGPDDGPGSDHAA